jgi:hypothetical protein
MNYIFYLNSLAFLECFTIVVFIEVKVIQFLVFSVVQNCICYVFYSVCLVFGLSSFLALSQSIECKFFTIRQYLWRHSDCVKFYNSNNILITSSNFSFLPRVSPLIIFEEGHLVPSFVVLLTLYYRSVVVWKTSHHWSERHWSVFNFIFKLHNFHCLHPFYTFPVSTKPICEYDHDWLFVYILANGATSFIQPLTYSTRSTKQQNSGRDVLPQILSGG